MCEGRFVGFECTRVRGWCETVTVGRRSFIQALYREWAGHVGSSMLVP